MKYMHFSFFVLLLFGVQCTLQAQTPCQQSLQVSGFIKTVKGEALPNVRVYLHSQDSLFLDSTQTDNQGFYQIAKLPPAQDYHIRLAKNDDSPFSGIDDRDALLLRQFILNVPPPSYLQLMAADLRKDNSLTTLDLVTLSQLIMEIPSSSPDPNNHWRFISTMDTANRGKFDFSRPSLSQAALQALRSDLLLNFIGLKEGDVDFSVRIQ
ncbi:MAG: hypothetical protein AAFV95_23290 [Bacteroidota bacterium]